MEIMPWSPPGSALANQIRSLFKSTNPSNHDSTHPHGRRKPLQRECRYGFEEHIWVIEYTQSPSPLRAGEVAELLLDPGTLFEIDDGRVGDVGDVDPHDQIHKGVPYQQMLVDFATRSFGGLLS